MSLNVIRNIQIVTLFDEPTSTNWTYQVDWMTRKIGVYREKTKLTVFEDCQLPVTVPYLQSLSNQTNNVRTLQ